jgi:hypothetical protein
MRRTVFNFSIILYILLFFAIGRSEETNTLPSMPVYYPEKIIGTSSPFFIWYDKYSRKGDCAAKYSLTLKPEKGAEFSPILIVPDVFENNYFYFRYPALLESGKYIYSIDKLENNKPVQSKYFHDLKYPINGEFYLDPDVKAEKEDLPPGKFIEYLRLEKENRLLNRNNIIFFSTASAGCFGIGLLFYKVLHFGVISKIIYYAAFASSGAGLGASGYYGYKYISQKNQLQKIIDIERNVSINSSISPTDVVFDFNISY